MSGFFLGELEGINRIIACGIALFYVVLKITGMLSGKFKILYSRWITLQLPEPKNHWCMAPYWSVLFGGITAQNLSPIMIITAITVYISACAQKMANEFCRIKNRIILKINSSSVLNSQELCLTKCCEHCFPEIGKQKFVRLKNFRNLPLNFIIWKWPLMKFSRR